MIACRRHIAAAALLAALASAMPGRAPAQALQPMLEGFLGAPLEPNAGYWEYHRPTTLLERSQFVITMSGQVADLLGREYSGGGADRGFALGINGGAVAKWDYGVTGVWALGGGQTQRWSDADGIYHLTPSPKLGLMIVSHAYRSDGGWEYAGTFHRASFSLSDTFVFDRYPTTDDPLKARYLYSLIPDAIGPEVEYDAVGDRLQFIGEVARPTRIGHVAMSARLWGAEGDWVTRHTNTIYAPGNDATYLAGRKTGDGFASWSGRAMETHWSGKLRDDLSCALHTGWSDWSGKAGTWLRDPATAPVEKQPELERVLESNKWLADTIAVSAWSAGAFGTWRRSRSITYTGSFVWERHAFDTQAFGRTPALNIDRAEGSVRTIEHRADVAIDGHTTVLSFKASARYIPETRPWSGSIGAGLVHLTGSADVLYDPLTVGFHTAGSHEVWSWNALRLGYIDVAATRRFTSQITVTYSLRQYVPLSGSWSSTGGATEFPGELSGIQFGSLHQLTAALAL